VSASFDRRDIFKLPALLAWPAAASPAGKPAPLKFRSALPVWPKGRETELNLTVRFRAVFDAPPQGAVLRIAGSSLYRVWVNGVFRHHGPARAARGFFRVDEIGLDACLRPGRNVVAIEVAGYNVNSYYLLDQPSFLQAEVVAGTAVLASTGDQGARFEAAICRERVQKIHRYSFQRTFAEAWRLEGDSSAWTRDPAAAFAAVECAPQEARALIPRRVPYPEFHCRGPVTAAGAGRLERRPEPVSLKRDRSITRIGPNYRGFREAELDAAPGLEAQRYGSVQTAPADGTSFGAGTYRILDFGVNLTGFIGARITCRKPVTVWFTFDEILREGDVDFLRLSCTNVVEYRLGPGTHYLESFEPYTLRYLKIAALEADCEVDGVYLREIVNPEAVRAEFAASDNRLNRLFAAGRETFRQNAVDVFMDCPSRERAGWLCDSFFTARVAALLAGNTSVEHAFLENYALPESFPHLPAGMVPMCYPADHDDGVFIPNWALWLVLQAGEYAARGGDPKLLAALEPKIMGIFDYFKPFENTDGLLEKLKSWVFVEWSAANKFVQDVNYPSNMLYAAALDTAARLYRREDLAARAARVRRTVLRQSFDGEFFVDNAVRREGKLERTRNRTEVCQYFAFYFGVATPRSHPKLWRTLLDDFGPDRAKKGLHPGIHAANSFVGNVLRLELLSRYGHAARVLEESVGYLLYMAERTGTLWENVGTTASCNHGFASHVVQVLYRDVLGVAAVDRVKKTVRVRIPDSPLEWCGGRIPLPEGEIELRWWKEGGKVRRELRLPAGYHEEHESDR